MDVGDLHTPGPWRVDGPHKNDITSDAGGIGVTIPKSARGSNLAVEGLLAADDQQSYANARLIAAAPDMLDALRALNGGARPSNWQDDDGEADAWRQLDAALAKATPTPAALLGEGK